MIWQAILVAAAVIFVAIIAHAVIVAPTVPNEPQALTDAFAFDEYAVTEPGSPRPLLVDTATGSHDHIPMRDDIRHMVTDYCEAMWHHTQEMP